MIAGRLQLYCIYRFGAKREREVRIDEGYFRLNNRKIENTRMNDITSLSIDWSLLG